MKPRHLFIIGNYPPDDQWSMRLFADIAQSAAESGGWKVTRLVPAERFGRGRKPQTAAGKYLGYLDKYVLAPAAFRRELRHATQRGDAPALVHIADHSNAIYNNCFGRVPVLVTCHDLIAVRRALGEFPVGRPGRMGRMQQNWILNALKRAHHVAFDSDASRQDFVRLTGQKLDSDPVIFPCINQPLSAQPREEALATIRGAGISVRGPFLFHHGNAAWYKNREQVIDVFIEAKRQQPNLELVCSGARLTAEQKAPLTAAGVGDSVHEPGSISTEVLQALYSSADVFLFPSWIEGFGWPPVEAQLCGAPVVASNGGSLAEVLLDSALVADPNDKSTFVKHVLAILKSPQLAEGLRQRGFRNVTRFERRQMEADYLRAYSQISGLKATTATPTRTPESVAA